jgi:hypothetical protein
VVCPRHLPSEGVGEGIGSPYRSAGRPLLPFGNAPGLRQPFQGGRHGLTRATNLAKCDLPHTEYDDGDAMKRQSAEGSTMSEDAMSSRPSRLVRAVTAMFVFALGMLGGAGVAALLMPT